MMDKLDNPTQEDWFDIWAQELIDNGFIDELVSEPPTFILFKGYDRPHSKKKNVVMAPVKYTPDRIIRWNDKARGIFFVPFEAPNELWDSAFFNPHKHPEEDYYYSIIDVKGPTGNQKAYNTDFRFTQKWMWQKSKLYVQKVMLAPAKLIKNPKGYLWSDTFTPQRFLMSDKLIQPRTIPNKKGVPLWEVRSFKDFMSKLKKAST